MNRFLVWWVAMSAAASYSAGASLLKDLSEADVARVNAGKQVMVTEELEGMPWPRVKVYQSVDATPEEMMAVFIDYNNASKFVPNCNFSRISRKINPLTFEVDYEVAVPILADEAYTARNTLSRGAAGRLTVDWEVLKATSIKQSVGNFAVEPHGEGSIIRYTNLVEPSSAAAGLLKGVAIGQMKDTVEALLEQVRIRRAQSGGALAAEVDRMNAALGE